MDQGPDDGAAAAVAELFELCAYRVRVFEFASELPQAQWAALRYFARCNPGAADITSYAHLHALTGGTASRTVAHLARKGLLSRVQSRDDRRRKAVRVTARGRQALARDPLHALVATFRRMDTASLRIVAEALDQAGRALVSPAPAA